MADIKRWFQNGVRDKATHLIVVCDTFGHDDYPVFVTQSENVKVVENYYRQSNMQTVMEVYNLSKDMDTQLNEHRSFNY